MKIAVFLLSLGVALAVVKGMPREKRDATESLWEGDLEMDDQPSEDIAEKKPGGGGMYKYIYLYIYISIL